MHDVATVVLLQHGEKVRAVGDVPLTERGHEQARAAASLLAGLHPRAVVSSPMRRARQTAGPVADACGLALALDDRLRERMNLEAGMDPETFFEEWVRASADRAFVPDVGDSSEATGARMRAALEDHAAPGVVVLATHGGATVDLLRTLFGDDEVRRRAPALIEEGVPGGALTTLVRARSRWELKGVAETAHLNDAVTRHRP